MRFFRGILAGILLVYPGILGLLRLLKCAQTYPLRETTYYASYNLFTIIVGTHALQDFITSTTFKVEDLLACTLKSDNLYFSVRTCVGV